MCTRGVCVCPGAWWVRGGVVGTWGAWVYTGAWGVRGGGVYVGAGCTWGRGCTRGGGCVRGVWCVRGVCVCARGRGCHTGGGCVRLLLFPGIPLAQGGTPEKLNIINSMVINTIKKQIQAYLAQGYTRQTKYNKQYGSKYN